MSPKQHLSTMHHIVNQIRSLSEVSMKQNNHYNMVLHFLFSFFFSWSQYM
jgi:hypothetical protein